MLSKIVVKLKGYIRWVLMGVVVALAVYPTRAQGKTGERDDNENEKY